MLRKLAIFIGIILVVAPFWYLVDIADIDISTNFDGPHAGGVATSPPSKT